MNRIFFSIFLTICLVTNPQQVLSENIDPLFDSISEEIEQIGFSYGAKAENLLTTLYNKALQYPDKYILYTKCLYLEATLNNAQGIIDSTLKHRITAKLSRPDQRKDVFNYALLNYSSALSDFIQNNYAESFPKALYALEQFERLKDDNFIPKSLILLGNICSHITSYKMADSYYRLALQYIKPDQITYYLLQENIFLTSTYLTENTQLITSSAIDSIENLVGSIKKFDNFGALVLTYLNLGGYYSEKGEAEKAYQYYDKSLKLVDSIDNNRVIFTMYWNLGFYYQNIRQWNNAYKYYKLAEKSALRVSDLRCLSYVFSGISAIYESKNQIDSAYFYLQKHNKLNSEIFNNSKTIETYQAYVSILLESAKNKLELKNRTLIASIITFISIIILVVFVFITIQQKKRRQAIIKQIELAQRLKNEQEIQQLQKQQLESQIREISSYSLLLSSKNNILQQISDLAGQIPNKSKDIVDICHIIRNNFNAEQDWENFMIHFEKVHPDFFVKLKTYCNNLTENNLRSCAYFRIGLSTKEIAQILNLSPESIKSNRRRLKRRLGLSEKDSLDAFLRNI